MGELRIKKVKVTSDNTVSMLYERQNKNGDFDEYSFTCSDKARPEFYKAMQKIAPYVIEMCELPNDYLERIDVRGVSFSYSGPDDTMGATITAQMKLSNSYNALNLNTPHKASDSYSGGDIDPMQVLSSECIDALDKLCEEAEIYINGDRAQVSLFNVA